MICSRYIKLLLWPVFLCYDYSMDAVPLVESLVDSRLGESVSMSLSCDSSMTGRLHFHGEWLHLERYGNSKCWNSYTCQVLKIWCTASLSSIGCFYHCSHIWASCCAPATRLEHAGAWCQSYLWYLDCNSGKQLKLNQHHWLRLFCKILKANAFAMLILSSNRRISN